MEKKRNNQKKSRTKPLTSVTMGTFTEQVILPGVERIVENSVSPLREEIKAGFTEMRQGFSQLKTSIKILAGEIAELKVREEDQKHEERIQYLEEKIGMHTKR